MNYSLCKYFVTHFASTLLLTLQVLTIIRTVRKYFYGDLNNRHFHHTSGTLPYIPSPVAHTWIFRKTTPDTSP